MNLPATNLQPEIRFEQTLYKVHSTGKVGSWTVQTLLNHDDTATNIFTSVKVLGGKGVETRNNITKGKNVGRSNETTPIMQATFEAESKVKKKLDQGYLTEQPEEGAVAKNSLGLSIPMKAQPIEKVTAWEYPVLVQPKMDGHRLLATVQDDKVVLYSRGGKYVTIKHISSRLQGLYDSGTWDGTTLDGEVYCHGETLQAISSLVKRPQPDSEKLEYHIYDMIKPVPYRGRYERLVQILGTNDFPVLTHTATHFVNDEETLNKYHAAFLEAGYEGTMVRQGDAGYEEGKRSKSLMKKKDFQDAEFLIVDLTEGKPNERLGTRVGLYHCKTSDGKEFTVTAPGKAPEKHEHAVNGHKNIGKAMTVKFFNYTPEGVPFLPVALRVREDI